MAYQSELPRAVLDVNEAMKLIEPILLRVKYGTETDLIELAQEFDVMSIPATLLFKNGEYTKTRSGKLTAEQLSSLVK